MAKKIVITFVDENGKEIGKFRMNGVLSDDHTCETGAVYLQEYNDTDKNSIKMQIEIDR